MRRLLFLLLALGIALATPPANAAPSRIATFGRVAHVASPDPDIAAFLFAVRARATDTGWPQAAALTSGATCLKSGGIWSSLDGLWVYAAENAVQASIDLVARRAHTLVNSPSFSALNGYTGDAVSAYIDTGLNLSTATNFAQNNNSFATWVAAGSAAAGNVSFLGSDASVLFFGKNGTTTYWYVANNNFSTNITFSSQGGLWQVQRTGSNVAAVFQNGTSVSTEANASQSLPNRNLYVLASNNASGPLRFSNPQLALVVVGNSLAGNEAAAFGCLHGLLHAINAAF